MVTLPPEKGNAPVGATGANQEQMSETVDGAAASRIATSSMVEVPRRRWCKFTRAYCRCQAVETATMSTCQRHFLEVA